MASHQLESTDSQSSTGEGHQPGTTVLNPMQEGVVCSQLVEKEFPSYGDACCGVSCLRRLKRVGNVVGYKETRVVSYGNSLVIISTAIILRNRPTSESKKANVSYLLVLRGTLNDEVIECLVFH